MTKVVVTEGKMTIGDVLRNVIGTVPMERRLNVLLSAINVDRKKPFTGIRYKDGSLHGTKENTISYDEFVAMEVKVGNINVSAGVKD